jgi:hypothetical protein
MDPLGLLSAAVAVVVYPGGVFLVAAALLAAGRSALAPTGWTAPAAAGAVCAALAAALLPLPGSPALGLPDRSGPAPSLVPLLVLLGAAVALTGPSHWSRRRVALAAAVSLPALTLAATAATFSLPVIVALDGRGAVAARALAAVALLLGAPHLLPEDGAEGGGESPPAARALVLGALVLAGLSLWLPAALPDLSAAAAAALLLTAVAAHRRLAAPLARLAARSTAALATGAGVGAAVLGVLAVHP